VASDYKRLYNNLLVLTFSISQPYIYIEYTTLVYIIYITTIVVILILTMLVSFNGTRYTLSIYYIVIVDSVLVSQILLQSEIV